MEAALECSFCHKKFKERKPLLEHEQYHIDSQKFLCQICKEKFLDETFFLRHMKSNHGVTKEMIPTVNAIAGQSTLVKPKPRKTKLRIKRTVKLPQDELDFTPVSSKIDTLNLSMNVAGILPTSASDMASVSQSDSNDLLTQSFLTVSAAEAESQLGVLSVPVSYSYTIGGSSAVLPNHSNPNCVRLASLNHSDGRSIRIQGDNLIMSCTVPLNDANIILQEQQHQLQESLAANTQNGAAQAFRMQNMF